MPCAGPKRLRTGPTPSLPLTDGSVFPWGRRSHWRDPAGNYGGRCRRQWGWWGGNLEWPSTLFTPPPPYQCHGITLPPWGMVTLPYKWILPPAVPLGSSSVSYPLASSNGTVMLVPLPTVPPPLPLPSLIPSSTPPLYPSPTPPLHPPSVPPRATVEGVLSPFCRGRRSSYT